MTLLLDMNISPKLVDMLAERQIDAAHWYAIGKPAATDSEIMDYAKENNCVVVTYDLDFAALLCAAQGYKPSVVQIRKQGLNYDALVDLLTIAVRQWSDELSKGAILTLDARKCRVRLLPLV